MECSDIYILVFDYLFTYFSFPLKCFFAMEGMEDLIRQVCVCHHYDKKSGVSNFIQSVEIVKPFRQFFTLNLSEMSKS